MRTRRIKRKKVVEQEDRARMGYSLVSGQNR